eukprot:COSAG01_NODE_5520_length_4206_cov_82.586316_5_plen_280_part_00
MRGNVTCWFLSTATLLAGAAAAAGHCPPTLRVAASSNRDAGLQIGAHFAPMIRDRFQRSSQLTALRAFVATAPGKTALDVLLRSARVAYGSYVEEMEAIADGAGVSRTDAALMNFRHELGALAPGGAAPSAAAAYSECSDVSAAGFIAHNEDGFDPSNNHTYILNVSIAGETTQWWLAYWYARTRQTQPPLRPPPLPHQTLCLLAAAAMQASWRRRRSDSMGTASVIRSTRCTAPHTSMAAHSAATSSLAPCWCDAMHPLPTRSTPPRINRTDRARRGV